MMLFEIAAIGFERNFGCASTACIRVVSRATSAVRRLAVGVVAPFPIPRPPPVAATSASDIDSALTSTVVPRPLFFPIFFIFVSVATRISVPTARAARVRRQSPRARRPSPSVAAIRALERTL